MISRLTIGEAPPENLDGMARAWQEEVSQLRGQGMQKAYLLADRQSGKVVGVAVWESQEAMEAAEQKVAETRQRVMSEAGAAAPPTLEVYEVIGEV